MNDLGVSMPSFGTVGSVQQQAPAAEPMVQSNCKILSIDFDVIMFPCISIYNDLCGGDGNSMQTWDRIEAERNADKFLNHDPETLKSLVRALVRNSNAVFVPCEEHQQIADWILQNRVTECEIVNVDHHHDLFYNPNDLGNMEYFNQYSCANWLGYLIKKGIAKKATWIKSPNSSMPADSMGIGIRPLSDIDLLNGFDVVFLVFSPQWVPYKFRHLYEMMIDVVNEVKKEK